MITGSLTDEIPDQSLQSLAECPICLARIIGAVIGNIYHNGIPNNEGLVFFTLRGNLAGFLGNALTKSRGQFVV